MSEEPLNAETKIDEQRGEIVPAGRHYVRTHFAIPEGPAEILIGASGSQQSVSLDEIRALPARTIQVTLECAGNGRKFLEPRTPGEQWGLGAVGTATWTGPSLRAVVGAWPAGTVELLFRGADAGSPADLGRRIAYERSLPVEFAGGEDILLAYAMNGGPIPPEHGGPLRLIVPSWYGMASVKWLTEIRFLDRPFDGFFQKDRYVIDGAPVRAIEPRAVIASPRDGAELRAGVPVPIRGYAWSGRAPLERVTVSRDGIELVTLEPLPDHERHSWWEFASDVRLEPGEYALLARAIDRDGNAQPLSARWNKLGYANNAARPVRIRIVP